MTDVEASIESFFAKYAPATAKLGIALRAKLQKRLPGLLELVYFYERQESLVFSWSPTENGIDGVCGLSLDPSQVKLFFSGGDRLSKSDPKGLLQGAGKMVRHVVMNSVADFDRAEIEALTAAALKLANVRLDPGAQGSVILKSEAQKQRAQSRAKKSARPAPARRGAKARR